VLPAFQRSPGAHPAMSEMGHHRPIRYLLSMSASPPTAAVTRRLRMGRKVPRTDSCTAAKFPSFGHLVGEGEER